MWWDLYCTHPGSSDLGEKHGHLMIARIISRGFSHPVIFRLKQASALQKHSLYWFVSVEASNETELALTKSLFGNTSLED